MKSEKWLERERSAGRIGRWLRATFIFHFLLFTFHFGTAQSVLRQGTWLKIGVTQTGVHKLDQPTLARVAPALASADPRRLRLYGNGGSPLPQPNASPRPTDLTENAVLVTGDADGRFDAADALYFFGQSTTSFSRDAPRRLTHQRNPYSDTTYYFLTLGDASPGLRLAERPVGNLTTGAAITTFTDYIFREEDVVNLVQSGREWLGDEFNSRPDKAFAFTVPGRVAGAPLTVSSAVVAGAVDTTFFDLSVNGQAVGRHRIEPIVDQRFFDATFRYYRRGVENQRSWNVTVPANDVLTFTYLFNRNGQAGASAYLNFLAVAVPRDLRAYAQPTLMRLPAGRYVLRDASAALRVWNVTNPLRPQAQNVALTGTEAAWAVPDSGQYWCWTEAQTLAPATLRNVANQNVRGLTGPELLIVTAPHWQAEAERLALHRRQRDGLNVAVATTEQIFNEWASGQPDPTAIRDAARHFYRQNGRLRYLLLMGDATFDYRGRLKSLSPVQQAALVPTYQSRESLHPIYSYASDDYFGFLKDKDGEWAETFSDDELMDIGVGRLPVKSVEEARRAVDKLIAYDTDPKRRGDWQRQLTFVADDGDYNTHQLEADSLARTIERTNPAYRTERLLLDDFPQNVVSSSPYQEKAPTLNAAFNKAVQDGRLIINYTGHGGVSGLAQEQILTLTDIFSWTNRRLPLLVTATCEFGRFDDPDLVSAAEVSLLRNANGAVALLTTGRPVFSNTNFRLNNAFYSAVFRPLPDGGQPRLGDVMRWTKNESLAGPLNRNFSLLGDPSMQLDYPQNNVAFTRINGKDATTFADTLRPLQSVVLEGEIRSAGQTTVNATFNGLAKIQLYDKAVPKTTLGGPDESTSNRGPNAKFTYRAFDNLLVSGLATVRQGRFMLRATLPRDVAGAVGTGRLYAYAISTDSLTDAAGANTRLLLGGPARTDSADTQPPVVAVTVDGASGNVATVAGPDVTLRIRATDNRGLTLTPAGGRAPTLQLADGTPVVIDEFFVSDTDNARAATAVYTLRGLANGTYRVQARAWDVGNNPGVGALEFQVTDRPVLTLRSARAYPNPLREATEFWVEHSQRGHDLNWKLTVLDYTGRTLWKQNGTCFSCDATLPAGRWEGRTQTGATLPNGLYLYIVEVQSSDGPPQRIAGRLLLAR